jgi:hypothetical protein
MVGMRVDVRNYEHLRGGVSDPVPGSLFVLALSQGVTVAPAPGRELRFGRNRPQVDLCVGEDDLRVSRQTGVISHRDGGWQVRNTGRLPIRLPGDQWLFPEHEPLPLIPGYTPMFVRGTRGREHVLEVYVIGPDGSCPPALFDAVTQPPKRYWLTAEEKLVLVVLGQRYFAQEAFAQPLGRKQVAEEMAELQPDEGWTEKKVDRTIAAVRLRLHHDGVPGLMKEELVEPIGNMLNHNLVQVLMSTSTLVPSDLKSLDGWD